jgi:hypothetical protein
VYAAERPEIPPPIMATRFTIIPCKDAACRV